MEEKQNNDEEFEINFYNPQSKLVHSFKAKGVNYPNLEVIEFFDEVAKVWRAKSVRHLC